MRFAVVRHPDVAAPGVIPESALAMQRAQGWYRVSDWRGQPADFHLPDFADVSGDLDDEPAQPAEAETTAARHTPAETEE